MTNEKLNTNMPWENEPDFLGDKDDATGYYWFIKRNYISHTLQACVMVPENHPYYDKSYLELPDLDVHGGVTGDWRLENEEGEKFTAFSFDTAHATDWCPKEWQFWPNPYIPTSPENYRTMEYVKNEVLKLAKQLKELE
jgi:hypothetical protein